jgi:hypothetical protein
MIVTPMSLTKAPMPRCLNRLIILYFTHLAMIALLTRLFYWNWYYRLTTLMTGSYRVPTLVLIHPGAEPAVDAGCAGCFSKTKAATTSLFADVATLYFVCPVTMLPVPCGPDGKGYRVSSVKAWVRKVAPVLKVGVHVLRAALAVYGT